ncbi:MAG: DUF6364 family protein [Bacteroidota bacterium]
MDTKLTLSLDAEVIENAKGYAKQNGTSLSKLIESYLSVLVTKEKQAEEVTPLVRSLIGVVDLKSEDDHRKSYRNHLVEKYK